MKKKIKNKGFTLIELMIVVAIIGLLASIAMPAYQDYAAKTQIFSIYQSVTGLKTAVEMHLISSNSTADPTDLGWISGSSSLLLNDPKANVDAKTGIAIIEATLDGRVHAAVVGSTLNITRDATGKWTCGIKRSSNSGWKDNYAPRPCVVN